METKILPYSELKDLPGYEDLCETSYNTLVEVVDKTIPKAKELNLRCVMSNYGGYEGLTGKAITESNECGTCACVIGVIATLFPVEFEYLDPCGNVYFYPQFQSAVIPRLYENRNDHDTTMWDFLFSEDWPNSFELGVERIKTVLSGDYAEDWDYDWHGKNPLFNF